MAKKKSTVGKIVDTVMDAASCKGIQKLVLGEYTDGSPRSIFDAIDGEILSPKDTKKYVVPEKKGKKKHK